MAKITQGVEQVERLAEAMRMPIKRYLKKPIPIRALEMMEDFEVDTLEGVMSGKKGDFLAIGNHNELYPIRRDIFEDIYDEYVEQPREDTTSTTAPVVINIQSLNVKEEADIAGILERIKGGFRGHTWEQK